MPVPSAETEKREGGGAGGRNVGAHQVVQQLDATAGSGSVVAGAAAVLDAVRAVDADLSAAAADDDLATAGALLFRKATLEQRLAAHGAGASRPGLPRARTVATC